MPLTATCPACKATFRVVDELAGKKVKCQKCQAPFVIPAADTGEVAKQSSSDKIAAGPGKPASSDKIAAGPGKPASKSKKQATPPPVVDISRYKRRSGCSTMTILIVTFLGGGLLVCVGCMVAGWWWYQNEQKLEASLIAAGDKKAKEKKSTDKKTSDKKGEDVKDATTVDAGKGKTAPPDDPLKDKKAPTTEGKDKDKKSPPADGPVKEKKVPPPPPPPAGVINVVFGPDGVFRSSEMLADADPRSAHTQRPYKGYQLAVEPGQIYQIEMVSVGFPPYLFLLDEKNKKIKEDEDSGGPSHARIVYEAKTSGAFRIQASTFGNKLGKFTLVVRLNPDGVPPPFVLVGSYLQRNWSFPKGTRLADGLVWAPDGKSFYALTESGGLLNLNPDTGATIMEKAYDQKCGNLAVSAEGLLLSVPAAQEVWIIDPDKLDTIKKKITVPSVARVTAGTDGKFAVVARAEKAGLNVIDLVRGTIVKAYPEFDTRFVTATPDGKYVIAQTGDGTLTRFRFDGEQLIKEESTPKIANDGQRVCISPDSKHVCLPSAGGNGVGHPNHPAVKMPHVTYVYPVGNLKRPLCAVESGPNPQAVGFDPKGGAIYTQNNIKPMMIFTYTGSKKAEFDVKDFLGKDIREIAMAPLGFEMVMRTDDRIVYIKMNK